MGDDLGVGLGVELGALALQLLAQLAEILDDAVVHDRDAGRWRADGRWSRSAGRASPSAYGRCRSCRASGSLVSRLSRLRSLPSARRRVEMAAFERRDAGGIIAAIFEPLERIDELHRDRLAPEDADNPAHERPSPRSVLTLIMPGDRLRRCNGAAEITLRVVSM